MTPDPFVYQVSVCICTRNRPEALRVALDSVQASSLPPLEIIVSDDSTDVRTEEYLRKEYPLVRYLRGPRRGLGANRNRAVSRVRGTHVLFLDDDAALTPAFLSQVFALLDSMDPLRRKQTIVSGIEMIHGRLIYPSDMGFLGNMDRPRTLDATNALHTSVINATIFPVELFQRIGFDENLIYGSDESDITNRATALGYSICLLPGAINYHFQSPINRADYAVFTQGSRLYSTFKLYYFVHRQRLKGFVYIPSACIHLVLHGLRRRGIVGLSDAWTSIVTATRYLRRYLQEPTDGPHLPATQA